ncbi:MAG: hypothetical protein ACFCA4_03400 [Cyanophyceae cyanobacterium]
MSRLNVKLIAVGTGVVVAIAQRRHFFIPTAALRLRRRLIILINCN